MTMPPLRPILAAAFALALPGLAAAQDAARDFALREATERARATWTTILTCSADTPDLQQGLILIWEADRAATFDDLRAAGIPEPDIRTMDSLTSVDSLLPEPGTPEEQITFFCNSQDWRTADLDLGALPVLSVLVQEAFAP